MDQSIASPVASKGAATTSPARGTTRATSAVTLNGSATAPHAVKKVQISTTAKTRIGFLRICAAKRHFVERAGRASVPCKLRSNRWRDPFWDHPFPAEQARLVQLLLERVDVHEDALEVWVRAAGLASLVAELRQQDERKAA